MKITKFLFVSLLFLALIVCFSVVDSDDRKAGKPKKTTTKSPKTTKAKNKTKKVNNVTKTCKQLAPDICQFDKYQHEYNVYTIRNEFVFKRFIILIFKINYNVI